MTNMTDLEALLRLQAATTDPEVHPAVRNNIRGVLRAAASEQMAADEYNLRERAVYGEFPAPLKEPGYDDQ